MELRKNELFKRIIAMLLIVVMTMAQFALVGTNAISYAIDIIATNSGNVEFCTYFENAEGEKVNSIDSSINAENLKLKVEIAVKNEGYFNGQVSLGDTSFRFKDDAENKYISKIENNIIYLKQLNADTTAILEVGIEYVESEQIKANSLNQASEVILTGTYVKSKNNNISSTEINGKSEVTVNWKTPDTATQKLSTKLLTNSVYNVEEIKENIGAEDITEENKSATENSEVTEIVNKRIIQFMVGSKIDKNIYPIKNTKIEVQIPGEAEEVLVHKRTTNSTNGNDEFEASNYEYDEENKKLIINIANNQDENGYIDWIKDSQDLFVITCKYPDTADLTGTEIEVNGQITTYDEEKLSEKATLTIEKEIDGIVTNSIVQQENEIYKGKIYTGEEREYNTTTIININYVDAIKSVEIKENKSVFVTEDDKEKEINIKYSETKINKSEFIKIFGENGYITIKDQDGNIVANITKNSKEDESGNIVVKYNTKVTKINIKTSEPVVEGILVVKHTKQILDNEYSREEINTFTGLKEIVESKYISEDNKENKNTSEKIISLKETQTEAHLNLETENVTANGEEKVVKMQVVLESYKESQDVYKNPIVKITFPSEIYVEAFTANLLYDNGLQITNKTIEKEDGKQVIILQLKGEQEIYLTETEKGTTIQINAMTVVDSTQKSATKSIELSYTNENALSCANGGQDKANVQILEQSAMLLSENVDGITDTQDETEQSKEQSDESNVDISEIEDLTQSVVAKVGGEVINSGDEVKAGEIIDYTITLKNNSSEDITGLTVKANIPEEVTYIEYNTEYENVEEVGGMEYRTLYTEYAELREKEFSDLEIEAGKTKILQYSVRVNEQIIDETNITIEIKTTNSNINLEEKIEHKLKSAKIAVSICRPVGENNEKTMHIGKYYMYVVTVKNITDSELQNVKVSIDVNELLKICDIQYIVGDNGYMTTDTLINIEKIEAGEEINLDVYTQINQPTEQISSISISAKVYDDENREYRTNVITEDVENLRVTLEHKSSAEEYLERGEEITYTINIANIGKVDIENLYIVDELVSEYLELENIILNGKELEYSSNNFEINNVEYETLKLNISLKQGEEANLEIKAKVKEDIYLENDAEIDNNARLENDYTIAESKIVNYIKKTEELYLGDENTSEDEGLLNDNMNGDGEDTGNENPGNNGAEDNTGNIDDGNSNNGNGDNNASNSDSENNNQTNNNTNQSGGYSITGRVWIDINENGIRENAETLLEGTKVMLIDINNSQIAKDLDGNEIKATTDAQGCYALENIQDGKYLVVFEYDTEKYVVTEYQIQENGSSDAITRKITINGETKTVAATNTINITENIEDIDLGLIEAKIFDFELDKYVSKIVVSNSKETKTYNFNDEDLAKVEIDAKYLSGTTVMIEYKFKVTNNGEISGYVKEIVDYLPTTLTFNSSLNSDWYQSDSYLYNSSLENTKIEPGETKEVTLTVAKTMTESNTGLINNQAEINELSNSQGTSDKDSKPGNQERNEDDLGTANVIIGVKTGKAITYISLIIIIMLVIIGIAYIITKRIQEREE